MRKVHTLLLILFIATMSGCGRVRVTPEYAQVEDLVYKNLGTSIALSQYCGQQPLKQCLSRDEAVLVAFNNNQQLQSQLQDIGIAKADLVQAGLYTNPLFAVVANLPFQKGNTPNFSITTSFSLADFWQIPLRKKIFNAQVQSAVYQVVENMLDSKAQVYKAYDAVLYAQNQLATAQVQTNNQENSPTALIELHKTQVDTEQAQLKVATALITFFTILGISDLDYKIILTDTLDTVDTLPTLESLCSCAQESRPELANARWKIEQYRATVDYEKIRVVKDVNAGISYAQDFTANTGLGPEFDTRVPLFDQNQAAVARNKFLLEKSLHDYEVLRLKVKAEVYQNYKALISAYKQIELYKKQILPAYKSLLKSSEQAAHREELSKNLQESQTKLADTYYAARTNFADLERAVGRKIATCLKSRAVDNCSSIITVKETR